MDEITLRKLRFVPVFAALMLVISLWWGLSAPDKTVLIFTTGSKDGLYHRLATQIKLVVESNHDNIVIRLKPSAGSRENIARLDSNRAQIALVQNDAVGGASVRSLAALYPEVLHLLYHTNAAIHTLEDLRGKRVGVGARGSGTEQIATNLLSFAGVTLETNSTVQASFSSTLKLLHNSKLDAAFFLSGLGTPAIGHALQDKNIALAPISMRHGNTASPEIITRMFTDGFRVHYPHVSPKTIPLMAYAGRPAETMASMSIQAVLVCQKNADAEIIELITRTLFKHRAVLSQKEPAFTHLNELAAQTELQFPLHEGAENYYRRREPGFLTTYAEPMAFIMSASLLLWSVLAWAQRWYTQKQKNRIDTYYQAVDDVIRRLNDGTNLKEINELEAELLIIHQRASAELVKEQLAANESYIIYQNMLNGCQAMLVRMREKIQASSDENA